MAADTYIQFLIALVAVLALIVALAWLARRFGLAPAAGPRRGGRRLSVVEAAPLDGKRRLVLIARDGVEHLVLLGPNAETVIETGIAPPAAPAGTQAPSSAAAGAGATPGAGGGA